MQAPPGINNLDVDCRDCAATVMQIWEHASIPTVTSVTQLGKRIHDLFDVSTSLKKFGPQRMQAPAVQKQLQNYKTQLENLFDIADCKCTDVNRCRLHMRYKSVFPKLSSPLFEIKEMSARW